MSMPRKYESSTVITRISASSACRLDPAGVDILVLRTSMSLPVGVCGSRRQTLTTARRHDAIPGRDKPRGGDISIGLIQASRTPS